MKNDCFTTEEEIAIFRKINECPLTFKRLFRLKLRSDWLNKREKQEVCPICLKLSSLCYQEKIKLLQEIVTKNLSLVWSMIKKKRFPPSIDYSEIFNAGVLGLIKSVETFKVELGYKFSTYAFRGINFHINTALRSSNLQVVVSAKRRRLVQLFRFTKYLFDKEGSLDILDFSTSAEEHFSQKELRKIIRKVLKKIPNARDREIIRARFGIGGPKLTLQAIGAQLGLTRQGVQQIEVRVLCWLREQESIQQLAG